MRTPLAPTKSTDALSSLRGSAIARANSSRALLRATTSFHRAAPPSRTSSGNLRGFAPNQIVNTSIATIGSSSHHNNNTNKQTLVKARGPLMRFESDNSIGDFSTDGSFFTTDSVALRKHQMIADPIDGEEYNEDCSFADHETYVTKRSDEYEHEVLYATPTVLTFADLEHMRLTQRLKISCEEQSEVSFSTIASGLSADFTEHDTLSEFCYDETENE
jgi:hypothetical protein